MELTMRIECAWCAAVMQDGDEPVSHGVCHFCFVEQLEHRQLTDDEFAEVCKREPDAVRAPLSIWHTVRNTLAYWAGYMWAFDCRLTTEQVCHHFDKVIQPRHT